MHVRKTAVRKEVKRRIIAGIDESELVSLTFAKKDINASLRWVHSKEFEYNKQMYDIVTKREHGDSISFSCWWDSDETELNKQLSKLAQIAYGNDPAKNQNQNRVLDFYKSLFVNKILNMDFCNNNHITQNYCFKKTQYLLAVVTPPTPPPKSHPNNLFSNSYLN